LLLPIIIFSSAFNIEQYALSFFMMKFRKISLFAVFGTLSALLFTGSMTYYINESFVDETNPNGLLEHKLQLWDAMMFGSLISAVDPVATLAAFATVGIDPRVYALIYGESILNDAVAIVAFSVFKRAKEVEQTSQDSGEMALASFKTFVTMGIGSVAIGLVFGVLVTFLSRFHGTKPDQPPPLEDDDDDGEDADDDAPASAADAHMKDLLRADVDGDGMITAEELTQPHLAQNINTVQQFDTNMDGKLDMDELRRWDEAKREGHKDEHEKEHKAVLESAVFFFASLSSYYLAECVHVSGIICALVCGLICNQFAVHWMSNHAKKSAKFFYITLSEISDHLILLWVGLLFYYALESMPWRFSIVSLGLVVLSRALSVFLVGAIGNICSDDDHDVPQQHQFMMIAAGLRGAVALALVMQMPSIAAEEIASTTLFIIVVTNVVLGGLTAPMVSLLGIPNEKNGTLNLAAFTLTKREKEFARSWHDKRDRLRKRIGLMDHHLANTDHQTTHQARREQLLMAAMHAGGADDDTPDDVPVEDADGSEEIIQNPLDTLDDVATKDGSEVAVQHPISSPGDGRGED
jgi:NhaP-type Na+/H+ or K+/H+ antiporter